MPNSVDGRLPKKHDSKATERRKEFSENGSQWQPFFQPEDWITKAEAARLRGVSRQAIAKLVKKGNFQTLQIAGTTLLKRSEVVAYTSKSRGRPPKS